jgi:hypothetical protein
VLTPNDPKSKCGKVRVTFQSQPSQYPEAHLLL